VHLDLDWFISGYCLKMTLFRNQGKSDSHAFCFHHFDDYYRYFGMQP
jgi:hypothetical protein